jgi:predicted methyltransferase
MRTFPVLLVGLSLGIGAVGTVAATSKGPPPALIAATKAANRKPADIARDRYRHPAQTLAFFGIKPTDTVVEIWPGGGWYTDILAPYLAARGKLYAAGPDDKGLAMVRAKQAAAPAAFRSIAYAIFPTTNGAAGVPAGTADVVLTFRNVHNWRFGETDRTQAAFDQMFAMLRPGGTLGLVEHHLPEQSKVEEGRSGYMKRSSVIAFAAKAGFKLVGESQINANARDSHDYPKGVWTLPPTYTEGDKDRARYAAIGESDRMTLKFVKPRT